MKKFRCLFLVLLCACSGEPRVGVTTTQDKVLPPFEGDLARDQIWVKVRPLGNDGRLLVYSLKVTASRKPDELPFFAGGLVAVDGKGEMRPYFDTGGEENVVDFASNAAGEVVLLTASEKGELSFLIFDSAGSLLSRTQVTSPADKDFDARGDAHRGRFFWKRGNPDAGSVRFIGSDVHVAVRNARGSVVYFVMKRKNADLERDESSVRFVVPGGLGSLPVAYSGMATTDVFGQTSAQYSVFLDVTEGGHVWIGSLAVRDMYRLHGSRELKEFGEEVDVSMGIVLTHLAPGTKAKSTFMSVPPSGPSDLGLHAFRAGKENILLGGRHRGHDGTYRGFVQIVSPSALTAKEIKFAPLYVSTQERAAVVKDVRLDGDSVTAVGAIDFSFNPSGLSIYEKMTAFVYRLKDGAVTKLHESLARAEGSLADSAKEPLALLPENFRPGFVCTAGNFGPYTHTCDGDWRKFKSHGYIECQRR